MCGPYYVFRCPRIVWLSVSSTTMSITYRIYFYLMYLQYRKHITAMPSNWDQVDTVNSAVGDGASHLRLRAS